MFPLDQPSEKPAHERSKINRYGFLSRSRSYTRLTKLKTDEFHEDSTFKHVTEVLAFAKKNVFSPDHDEIVRKRVWDIIRTNRAYMKQQRYISRHYFHNKKHFLQKEKKLNDLKQVFEGIFNMKIKTIVFNEKQLRKRQLEKAQSAYIEHIQSSRKTKGQLANLTITSITTLLLLLAIIAQSIVWGIDELSANDEKRASASFNFYTTLVGIISASAIAYVNGRFLNDGENKVKIKNELAITKANVESLQEEIEKMTEHTRSQVQSILP
ncbi:MAG: hypothetical protein AB7F64_04540 [Gammaproteobacteria bacterium]